jgi:hypothetical protein
MKVSEQVFRKWPKAEGILSNKVQAAPSQQWKINKYVKLCSIRSHFVDADVRGTTALEVETGDNKTIVLLIDNSIDTP